MQGMAQLDAIYVAVGGGGLISGIGTYVKEVSPATEIVGCWPERSPVLYESIRAGKIVDLPDLSTLSTSTAGNLEQGSVTFAICRRVIDEFVLVTEEEIFAALRLMYAQSGIILEGAAGVAVAAFLKDRERRRGQNVAIVLCGGNADPELRKAIAAS
jgi:threonine dehydratase